MPQNNNSKQMILKPEKISIATTCYGQIVTSGYSDMTILKSTESFEKFFGPGK